MIRRLLTLLFRIFTVFKYRINKNIKLEDHVTIDFGSKIMPIKGSISLKSGVQLRSNQYGYHAGMPFRTTLLTDIVGSSIEIGENSRINGAYIHAQKKITLGKNCLIASGVNILDSNGHVLKSHNRTQGRDEPDEIIIEDNVWIGINSIVLKGTIIGKNSVVGANSVVKGIFPANSLIVGNPAVVSMVWNSQEFH